MNRINFWTYNFPIGEISIAEDEKGICGIFLPSVYPNVSYNKKETPLIKQAEKELREYFEGTRKVFTLPLSLKGTPFQMKVWEELRKIPYGETLSYGQIAENVGNPKAARAVGMANNKNPIMIIVPCHRVIGKNGKLVGYAGGVDIKEKLLKIEGVL